jgi:alpha-N-arabinofuranosidase
MTVTNPSMETARTAEIMISGGRIQSVSAMLLAAKDVHAHNSFDDPHSVEPHSLTLGPDELRAHTFPPASVTKFEVLLG